VAPSLQQISESAIPRTYLLSIIYLAHCASAAAQIYCSSVTGELPTSRITSGIASWRRNFAQNQKNKSLEYDLGNMYDMRANHYQVIDSRLI
jgi:hypothetical protein